MVVAEIPNSTNSAQPSSDGNIVVAGYRQPEVHVKSSNAGSEVDVSGGDVNDETDSSDDDLDQTVTDLPARALPGGDITPATARTINQTIMETPHGTTFSNADSAANEPYSTAQEVPTSDTVMLSRQESGSPSARAQASMTAKDATKGSPVPLELANLTSTPPGADAEMQDQTPLAVRLVNGKPAGTNSIPNKAISNRSGEDSEQVEEMEQDDPVSRDPALSSEYAPKDIAFAAASASVASSAKRKLSEMDDDIDDEEEEDVSSSAKKQKTNSPPVVQEQWNGGQDGRTGDIQDTGGDDDDISIERSEPQSDIDEAEPELQTKQTKKSKKGRAPKPIKTKIPRKSLKSLEPPKSSPEVVVTAQRSVRKRKSDSPPSSMASSTLTGKAPSILLSSDSPLRRPATAKFLDDKGASIIDDVKTRRAHFVCVLNGNKLTTTAKVLRSLALGKLVVTEDWITASKKAKVLLDPEDYVHKDLKPNIDKDRSTIFKGTNLFFTKALAEAYGSGLKAIKDLAKDAGASHVEVGSSAAFGTFKEGKLQVICFGQRDNDVDVGRLRHSHKVKVYHKNLLTQSILKGELDMDGEEHVL